LQAASIVQIKTIVGIQFPRITGLPHVLAQTGIKEKQPMGTPHTLIDACFQKLHKA
jgi:hypothetical protein